MVVILASVWLESHWPKGDVMEQKDAESLDTQRRALDIAALQSFLMDQCGSAWASLQSVVSAL